MRKRLKALLALTVVLALALGTVGPAFAAAGNTSINQVTWDYQNWLIREAEYEFWVTGSNFESSHFRTRIDPATVKIDWKGVQYTPGNKTVQLSGIGDELPPGNYTAHATLVTLSGESLAKLLGGIPQLADWVTKTKDFTIGNTPPTANSPTVQVGHLAESKKVSLASLASDPNVGQTLTITITGGPAFGTAEVDSDNSIVYYPSHTFAGLDQIQYSVSDGTDSRPGTLSIEVGNQKPQASNDQTDTVLHNTSVNEPPNSVSVTLGATDGDTDALEFKLTTDDVRGDASISDGVLTYTPAAGFVGYHTLTYQVTDNIKDSDGNISWVDGSVTIHVNNEKPGVPELHSDLNHKDTATFDVLSRCTDHDDSTSLKLESDTAPTYGSVVYAGGTIVYTPSDSYCGEDGLGYTDEFTYKVSDGLAGGETIGKVKVAVTNGAPTAYDYSGTIDRDETFEIADLLAKCTDDDGGDDVSLVSVNGAETESSHFDYTQNIEAYEPSVTIPYVIEDKFGAQSTGHITIKVNNAAPSVPDQSISTGENQSVEINLLADASDLENDVISVDSDSISAAANGGTISVSGAIATFTPAEGFLGADRFTYTIKDEYGATYEATVTIYVEGVVPVLEGVTPLADGTYYAHWGYINYYASTVDVGSESSMFSGDATEGDLGGTTNPPSTFSLARSGAFPDNAFNTIFNGDELTWTITDTHGVSRSVTASSASGLPTHGTLTITSNIIGDAGFNVNKQIDVVISLPHGGPAVIRGTVEPSKPLTVTLPIGSYDITAPGLSGQYTLQAIAPGAVELAEEGATASANVTIRYTAAANNEEIPNEQTPGGSTDYITITMYWNDQTLLVNKNGTTEEIELDVAPICPRETTLVPIRGVFEALGADVQWNENTEEIVITRGATVINLKVGSDQGTVNGKTYTMPEPVQRSGDRTLLPLRFISEALGYEVIWTADEPTKVIIRTAP